MNAKKLTHGLLFVASLGFLLAAPPRLWAASGTWYGSLDSEWAKTNNWNSTNTVPGTGNTATFNNAGNGNTTIDLGVGVTINSILFDTGSAAAYTISSGAVGSQTLNLNDSGAIRIGSAVVNDQTVNALLTLGTATAGSYTLTNAGAGRTLTLAGNVQGGTGGGAAAKTLNVAGAGDTTISGVIANGGGLSVAVSKSGTGVLRLSNVNTYSGNTTAGGGVLRADYGMGLPSASGVLYLNNNGVLETSGSLARTLGTGPGNVAFSGSGGFAARGGTIDVTFNAGAELTFGTTASFLGRNQALVLGSTSADSVVTVNNTLNFTANPSSDWGGLNVIHNASLPLNQDKGVLNGALKFNNSNAGNQNGWQKYGNGRLEVNGVGVSGNQVNFLISGGVLALIGSGDLSSYRGVWVSGGDFEITGAITNTSKSISVLGICNGSDLGGTPLVSYGAPGMVTLIPGAGVAVRLTASSASRSLGGTIVFRGPGLGTAAYPSANMANLIVTATAGLSLLGANGAAGGTTNSIVPYALGDGSVTGAGTDFVTYGANGIRLLNAGAGEYKSSITDGQTQLDNVSLTGGQTLNSPTTVNALRLDNGGSVDGSGTLTLNSGAVLALAGNGGISASTLAYGAKEAILTTIGNLTVSSALTGSGGLTKSGSGVLTLLNASALTGTNTINAGTLAAGAVNALPVLLKLQPGTIADIAGFDQSIVGLTGAVAGTLTNGGAIATLTFAPPSGSYGPGPVIAGNLNVVKTNAGTSVFSEGRLLYTGNTTVNGGVFEYQFPYTSTAPAPIPGGVSLNSATLRYQTTGGNGGATLSDAISIGAGGGTIDFRAQAAGGSQLTPLLTNTVSLGGNLTLQSLGNTHACFNGVTLQSLVPTTSATLYNDIINTDSPNGATVFLAPTITAPTRTLTLGGTATMPAGQLYKFQISGVTSNSLNLANLTMGAGSSLYMTIGSGTNPLAQIKANGGALTMGVGSRLTYEGTPTSPGPVFDPSAVVWQGSNTLVFERYSAGNRDSFMQIASNLAVSTASGLLQMTAIPWRQNLTITAPYALTIGSGGTLVWTIGSLVNEFVNGDMKLLNGATVTASYLTANTQGGLIRGTTGTLTLGDGSGTPANPSIVTVRGNQAANTAVFKIGYPTANTLESGTVKMKYASTSATAGDTFNIGWSAAGSYAANITAFRQTSGGTEFAPLAGGGGVAVVATNGNTVVALSNAVTVSTAGTVGFYNVAANNTRGPLGVVVVTNGCVFSITNSLGRVTATNIIVNGGTVSGIGTFTPIDMVFTNGGTNVVMLTGNQTNNCGMLTVSNTLTFAPGTPLVVDTNAYAPSPLEYWYIGSATTISGLPTPPADYSVAVEGGTRLKLTKLSSGTAPSIENRAATNIAHTAATLRGYLNSTGTAVTTVTVYWGTTDGSNNAAAWANTNTFAGAASPGDFATNVVTLVQDSQYYYRYYASNVGGDSWPTQSESFITGDVWVDGTLNAAEGGPVTGRFTFSRSPLLTNEALVVAYSVGGTASNGVDYATLNGTVTLPAGSSNVAIDVIPVNEAVVEGVETVTVTVVAGKYVPGSPASASIELQDYQAQALTWNGSVSTNWDVDTTVNWTGGSGKFINGDQVTFDDTCARSNVSIVGTVIPSTVLVTNATRAYSFSGGFLSGPGVLTKGGSNILAMGYTYTGLVHTGGTVIDEGIVRIEHNSVDGGPADRSLRGPVTLDGGTLQFRYMGAAHYSPVLTFTGAVQVAAGGGAIDYSGAANGFANTLGAMILGGNLVVSGDTGSSGYPYTFGGPIALSTDVVVTNATGPTAHTLILSPNITGPTRSLVLTKSGTGGGFQIDNASATSLNVGGLTVGAGANLSLGSGNSTNPLSQITANGGLLTMGTNDTLFYLGSGSAPGTILNPAAIAWQGNGTLDLPIVLGGNGDSSWRIISSLTVSTASGLTRLNTRPKRGTMTIDAPHALTVGEGGTYSVDLTSGAHDGYVSGNVKLLNGSILQGAGPSTGGLIRITAGTLTLGDGSGTPVAPSVVTVQGDHGAGYNTFNIGYANNLAETGSVCVKYASTSAAAGSIFNVGWSAGSVYTASLMPLRTTSGGTEFAPLAGGGGVAVVGPSSGTVATFSNAVTVSTAGKVGFHNADPGNTRGAWGPLVFTNGSCLAFSTNGVVQAGNTTFYAGSTQAVVAVGTASNAIGYLKVVGTLIYNNGTKLVGSNPARCKPVRGYWYVAEATSIIGTPSFSGFSAVEIEPGSPQRLKVFPDVIGSVFTFR